MTWCLAVKGGEHDESYSFKDWSQVREKLAPWGLTRAQEWALSRGETVTVAPIVG
jgi:hypothetical protein